MRKLSNKNYIRKRSTMHTLQHEQPQYPFEELTQEQMIAVETVTPEIVAEAGGAALDGDGVEVDDRQIYEEHVDEITNPIDLWAKYEGQGVITEEDTLAATSTAEVMLPHARVATRTTWERFIKILADGRLKSSHETGVSAATDHPEGDYGRYRREREQPLKMTDEDPEVIYGFLDYDTDDIAYRREWTYGGVKLVLRSPVTERSTFTRGDSLHFTGEPFMSVEDAVAVDQVEEIRRQKAGSRTPSAYNRATEAQVLGGVSIEDIERVVIDLDSRLNVESGSRQPHSLTGEETRQQLESLISTITEGLPETPVTLRIPDTGSVYSKVIIELAKKYPHVTFAIVKEGEQSFVHSRVNARLMQDSDPAVRKVGEDQQEKLERDHSIISGRLKSLRTKMTERSQEMGEDGLPENITFGVFESNSHAS